MKDQTVKVDSMLAVLGFGAAATSAARKLAERKKRPVLCRPSRGVVREIQPDGRWSQCEFRGHDIFDDMGHKLEASGKVFLFHYATVSAVRQYSQTARVG